MDGPQSLRQAIQVNLLEGVFARVIRREAAVIGGMPILCRDHQREGHLQFVSDRNHRVALGHRQCAAGEEVVLNINQDERPHWSCLQCPRPSP